MPEMDMSGGLPLEADLMLAEPPPPPFDWVREGTSLWAFEESGAFAIPRIGVEAEPWTWDRRRFAANFAFADGRVLQDAGVGPMPSGIDEQGRPAVLGGGPLTFRCVEPFRRWRVTFDGSVVDTTVANQIANTVDGTRRVPLRYELDLTMAVPANVQTTRRRTSSDGARASSATPSRSGSAGASSNCCAARASSSSMASGVRSASLAAGSSAAACAPTG